MVGYSRGGAVVDLATKVINLHTHSCISLRSMRAPHHPPRLKYSRLFFILWYHVDQRGIQIFFRTDFEIFH